MLSIHSGGLNNYVMIFQKLGTIYIGTREKVALFYLLERLSFPWLSLAIKTRATDVYLGEEKKSFMLIFSFVLMAVNC